MNQAQLDNRRHEMMEALYAASGRTCSTYTGLWEEFCLDIAANFRDTDYAELHAACVVAIGDTESIQADKHAQQAIAICRRQLLGKWA
jgi:hypothetical protein